MIEFDILKKLCEFNTVEDIDNDKIISWIGKYLEEIGFENKIMVCEKTGKKNMISTIKETQVLGFSGHTDTVPYADGWKYNPLTTTEDEDKIYGLGTCDMKGGIAAFLAAVSEVDFDELTNGVSLIFTFDEEKDFGGISNLIDSEIELPKSIIIPEPTEMKPIVATKGCIAFTAEIYGKSAHSSSPNLGVNAFEIGLDIVRDLYNLYGKVKEVNVELFEIPYATMNIGKFNSGDAVNKIPSLVKMEFEFRTVLEAQNEYILSRIKEIFGKYDANLKMDVDILPMNCENQELIAEIEDLAKEKSMAANYVTEGSYLQKRNCNVILLGPGPMTAHMVDECIFKEDLVKLKLIFKKLIEKNCK